MGLLRKGKCRRVKSRKETDGEEGEKEKTTEKEENYCVEIVALKYHMLPLSDLECNKELNK